MSNARRFAAVFLILTLASVFLACSKPAKVLIKPDKILLYEAEGGKTLNVTVLDQKENPMDKAKITFLSSAPEVADVSPEGKVTAKASGEAIITASVGKLSAIATVVVKIVPNLQVGLPESGTLGLSGSAVPLKVKAYNEKGDIVDLSGISFQSSAPQVAAVNENGVLTLVSTGQTTITASIGKTSTTLNVNVEIETPAAIKVDNPNQSLAVGETKPLEFTVLSTKGRPIKVPVALTTSSVEVATTDDQGNVTGVGRGTAAIMITAGSAKNTIKVSVR